MSATAATVAGLGLVHGLNPAMGWLWAVARGRTGRGVRDGLASLPVIALGHELSVVLVVVVTAGLRLPVPLGVLRGAAAALLIGLGAWRFLRPARHVAARGYRVGMLELGWWSFLSASAHGAGLMLLPAVLRAEVGAVDVVWSIEAAHLAALHVVATLVPMAVLTVVFLRWVPVGRLRRWWVDTDRAWAAAFVVTGLATLFAI